MFQTSDELKPKKVYPHQEEIFQLFIEQFSMDLIKSITTDTSLFLKYRYEDQGENIGIDEFYRVLSIILAICIHPVRDIRRHWSDDGHFKNEWIKETMSQTAFLQYFYNLRYCDKRTNQQHQPQQIDNNQDDEEDFPEELHQYLPKSQKYDKKYGIISAQERVEMLIAKFQALWLLAYQKYFRLEDQQEHILFNLLKNRNLESVQHVKNPECNVIAQNATPFIANNVSKSIYKILPSILIYDWWSDTIFNLYKRKQITFYFKQNAPFHK
ncbi:PiggyBac_transposable element-derived protein [Hexamita inflata]|uniref:PiggyBac_transposable element-derived protein n=1 Tax=Hexamita inflata TaxID=28002 RepID=A0ABP1LV70_9EUKA